MADLFQKCHHDLLEEVKRRDIYPYFHTLESRQAPVVEMEGKRRIMLGSNNYLGFYGRSCCDRGRTQGFGQVWHRRIG